MQLHFLRVAFYNGGLCISWSNIGNSFEIGIKFISYFNAEACREGDNCYMRLQFFCIVFLHANLKFCEIWVAFEATELLHVNAQQHFIQISIRDLCSPHVIDKFQFLCDPQLRRHFYAWQNHVLKLSCTNTKLKLN